MSKKTPPTSPPADLVARCRDPHGPVVLEAGPLTAGQAQDLAAELNHDDFRAVVIDGHHIANKAGLMQALAAAFSLPDYFGHNWDAVIDCLSDLSWLPARGYVVILLAAAAFRTRDSSSHDMLLQVARDVAQRWKERKGGVVFKLVRG